MNPTIILGQEEIINRIDSDLLGVATIIATIGAFVLAAVIIGCVTSTIQRVYTIRESNKLIMELLNRGYSAEEIEAVAYGNAKLGRKVGQFFRSARNAFRDSDSQNGTPVPPLKQSA